VPGSGGVIVVRAFQPGDEAAFRDINLDWISRFFVVEAKDRETLENPVTKILDPGGEILLACDGADAIGCVALMVMGQGEFELAKMGVRPQAQGRGVGRKLMQAAVDTARARGARRLYLETNSKLGPALKLYADAGFVNVQGPPSPYARADVQMELWLT
jgi:GNAT superfamily N-acetyltransferase